jgi:hypothetical protein
MVVKNVMQENARDTLKKEKGHEIGAKKNMDSKSDSQ